jgi:NAD(P)-dependent dehydrogenase (short-subunit alcohol dehydrogenase family)
MIETVVSDVGRPRAVDPEEVRRRAYHSRHPARTERAASGGRGVIRFLLSDEASYKTGQAVNVSGGLVMY